MRILLIEDDLDISRHLTGLLEDRGFAVDRAFTKAEGWEKAFVEAYDLVILDWMLPDGSGLDLCKELRQESFDSPILMLTAKSMLDDIESGLDAGADDFLSKPFEMRELMARIRSLSRRKPLIVPDIFKFRNLVVDFQKRSVVLNTLEINLSQKEFAILEYLIFHREVVVTREDLLLHIWDESSEFSSNVVDVYISLLRKKLGSGDHFDLIKTVKGHGYTLCRD